MLTLESKSKKSVLALRQIIRNACEEVGLRLGQSDKKTDFITAKVLGAKCINEAMAKAEPQVETAQTLTEKDIEELRRIEFKTPMFNINILSNKSPRTLLYGYDSDMGEGSNTVHVYIDTNGLLHVLVYNSYQHIVSHDYGEEIEAKKLIPSKRAYPSRTDKEFAFKLNTLLSYGVSYTSLDKEIQEAQYYGKLAETLNPIPLEYIEMKELSWDFHDVVQRMYCEEYAKKEGVSFSKLEFSGQLNPIRAESQNITEYIRRIGFSGVNEKQVTKQWVEALHASFSNPYVLLATKDSDFNLQRLNELFKSFLASKGFEFTAIDNLK